MNRTLAIAELAHVERDIRDGERHLSRQREIVDELERHGRGASRTAQIARDILATFEMAQSQVSKGGCYWPVALWQRTIK